MEFGLLDSAFALHGWMPEGDTEWVGGVRSPLFLKHPGPEFDDAAGVDSIRCLKTPRCALHGTCDLDNNGNSSTAPDQRLALSTLTRGSQTDMVVAKGQKQFGLRERRQEPIVQIEFSEASPVA